MLNVLSRSERIRAINDECRKTFTGCAIVVTAAVADLALDVRAGVLAAVRAFDKFDSDNDPHHEHDCAFFEHEGQRYFWKFDYYGLDMRTGSDDPADIEKTQRVLTIGFDSDW